jgi:AraC-like DNA-binding protein
MPRVRESVGVGSYPRKRAANLDWLLDEAPDLAVPAGPRFVAADESWQADVERLELAPSLYVYLNDIRIHRDLRVESMDDPSGDWVVSQLTIAGGADIDLPEGRLARTTPRRSLLFRTPGCLPAFSFRAGSRYHAVGYVIDPARVERLLDGEVPAVLRRLLDPDLRQSTVVAAPGDAPMRALASSLFNRGLNGALRRLMMEGVVLQLLAMQAAAASAEPPAHASDTLTRRDRTAVGEARQRLLADMRNPPTLGALADAVGLSEKRLNTGFRLMFGATAFEVLRNERLEHARQVLEADAASPKEVAYRVGYSHVSNFVHAFRARYGAPPRRFIGRASTR